MTGFTKLDNPVLEAILTANFTKRQLKILLLIVRFACGYQKTYAVIRKNDFSYAGVSPYCIKEELIKLVKRRVIHWDPNKDMVWINSNLKEWAVDKSGDNLRQFFKIATRNSAKRQLAIYQNSNPELAKTANLYSRYKESRNKLNKPKENLFLEFLRDYFLKVSPLTAEETFILQELVQSYHPRIIEEAISAVASGNDRSFSHFLKALDSIASNLRPREEGLKSLRSALSRYSQLISRP